MPILPRPAASRRHFLQAGLAASAGLLLPRYTFAGSPNETLNLASVGVGGKGWSDLGASAEGENVRVVALCDVDSNNLNRASSKFSDAKTFADYRKMFDAMSDDIDAVLISTPDHMHAPIALAAMQLGKHVHVQKPLANSLSDLRHMQKLAEANPKLVTQMGTQIHSDQCYRTAVQMVREGAIGKVREAHLWVTRSWAGPKEGRPNRTDPVPDALDWDLWLGAAPHRPYVTGQYHPENWRGWKDFGAGTLGDMGCHIYDPVFTALELGAPTEVVSRGPQHYAETFAPQGDVTYKFEPTDYTAGDFTLRWTDGSPPNAEPANLPEGVNLPGAGSYLVGEKGVMVLPHWAMPTFYSGGEKMDIAVDSAGSRNHYTEFTDACRGVGETSTPFAYSCRVTEAVLVGVVAGDYKDRQLRWTSAELAFDHQAATDQVERQYREGWRPAQLVG